MDGAVTISFVPFDIYVLTETGQNVGNRDEIGFSLKYTQVSTVYPLQYTTRLELSVH